MPQQQNCFYQDGERIPVVQLTHDIMITKPFIQALLTEMGRKGIGKFCTDCAAVNMQLETAGHLGPVEHSEFVEIHDLPMDYEGWFLHNDHRRTWAAKFRIAGEQGLGTNAKIDGHIIPGLGMVGLMSITDITDYAI